MTNIPSQDISCAACKRLMLTVACRDPHLPEQTLQLFYKWISPTLGPNYANMFKCSVDVHRIAHAVRRSYSTSLIQYIAHTVHPRRSAWSKKQERLLRGPRPSVTQYQPLNRLSDFHEIPCRSSLQKSRPTSASFVKIGAVTHFT